MLLLFKVGFSLSSYLKPNYLDAILCLGTQFQLVDINSSKSKKKSETVRLATSDSSRTPTLETRTASILGTKFLDGLSNINVDLSSIIEDKSNSWNVQGLISYSSASPHRTAARETHLFSINGRPVDLPNASRMIGDVWKSFDSESGRRPACILAFTLPNHAFDVNLSPDKRQVMFTEESSILGLIRRELTKHWAEQVEGKFEANEVETKSNARKGARSELIQTIDKIDVVTDMNDSNLSPKTEILNNVTPKSSQKKIGQSSNDSSYTDKLSSLTTKDKSIVTPTITQTQSEGLSAREETALQDAIAHDDVASKNVLLHTKETRQREQKVWEQMKLSFNRIDKSQQQKEVERILSPDSPTEEHDLKSTYLDANSSAVVKGTLSKRSNNTERAIDSCKDSDAYPSTAKETSKPKYVCQSGRTVTESVVINRHQRNITDLTAPHLDECKHGLSTLHKAAQIKCDGSKNLDESKERKRSMLTRQKARTEQLANTSGRISEGQRITLSSKLCEKMQGRARVNENKNTCQSPSRRILRQRDSKRSTDESNEPSEHKTLWNSFSGTQDIIIRSRQSQVVMRKRRKLLRQSIETENNIIETESNEDTKSVVNLCHQDFLHMSIIGQFNLGFILARCRNHNLWMLDQHACDEKYNFERLCKETIIHEQKLITPLQLELSPSEEHCVLENMVSLPFSSFISP